MKFFSSFIVLVLGAILLQNPAVSLALEIPTRPTDPQHPSSANYPFQVKKQILKIQGRSLALYLPDVQPMPASKFPLVAFGHGQATDETGYEETSKHLARKGIAVVLPTYDTGFFDQEWVRMGQDFNTQVTTVLNQFSQVLDANQVIYAGHSKGAYVALMAAGSAQQVPNINAMVLFAPAGFDQQSLNRIDPNVPVTVVTSDADKVIKRSLIDDLFKSLKNVHKQLILVKSYQGLEADHFFPLSKSFFFGGKNGVSPFHFFASWKFLVGAVQDVVAGGTLSNPYIYGSETTSTGVAGLNHEIIRNWSVSGTEGEQ